MAARHEEGCYEKRILKHFHVCKGLLVVVLSNDDVGAGVEGHRISGDTAGSWFQNRRFRSRKVGGLSQNDFFVVSRGLF